MIQLREYQTAAVASVYEHLRQRDDNPCVVIPTGGGKTPVMAQICKDAIGRWNGRVLILAHVKELLEQTAGTLQKMAPELDIGVYCAGLGSRDTEHPVLVASIQSVYQRACDLGRFDLILIDEAHLIPPNGEGMYRTFLADASVINPHIRLIGLTATPYRMKSGMICAPDHLLNHVCYEIGVKELIVAGYLCPLRSKAGRKHVNTDDLHMRAGEFVASEAQALMDTQAVVNAACKEIVEHTTKRHKCLIFCTGVEHAEHVVSVLQQQHDIECGLVTSTTPAQERGITLARFRGQAAGDLFEKKPPLSYLANINVLTTGFDAPNIDCVAILRPTASPGLFYQMCGRGLRTCEGKDDCLVLDFGGNIVRHGPIDAIQVRNPKSQNGMGVAPAKECPKCLTVVACGYRVCPECGYEFPPVNHQNHDAEATTESILSQETHDEDYNVLDITYRVHEKRDAPPDHPKTMRVEYQINLNTWHSEWVCFEHTGFARVKAEAWWRARSNWTVPTTAAEAVEWIEQGAICKTLGIRVHTVADQRYPRITNYTLEPRSTEPPPVTDKAGWVLDPEEIPF